MERRLGRMEAVPQDSERNGRTVIRHESDSNESEFTSSKAVKAAAKWIEGLRAEMPLPEALSAVISQRLRGLRFYLRAVIDDNADNEEHIHQLRVATRRVTAVLDVLSEGFADARRIELAKITSRIRRRCGAAREIDVRLAAFRRRCEGAAPVMAAALELLIDADDRGRQKVRRELQRGLPKLYTQLKIAGDRVEASLKRSSARRRKSEPAFGMVAARTLTREFEELFRLSEEKNDRVTDLHDLRVACKHVRYAAEVCGSILDDEFRDVLYVRFKHVQDSLGDLHDAVDAIRSLKKQKKKLRRLLNEVTRVHVLGNTYTWRDLKPAFEELADELKAAQRDARARFEVLWPDFAGQGFRDPMTARLDALLGGSAPAPVSQSGSTTCESSFDLVDDVSAAKPFGTPAVDLEALRRSAFEFRSRPHRRVANGSSAKSAATEEPSLKAPVSIPPKG